MTQVDHLEHEIKLQKIDAKREVGQCLKTK